MLISHFYCFLKIWTSFSFFFSAAECFLFMKTTQIILIILLIIFWVCDLNVEQNKVNTPTNLTSWEFRKVTVRNFGIYRCGDNMCHSISHLLIWKSMLISSQVFCICLVLHNIHCLLACYWGNSFISIVWRCHLTESQTIFFSVNNLKRKI